MRAQSALKSAAKSAHRSSLAPDTTLSTTQWFLLDHNANLGVDANIVDQMDIDDHLDPSRPPDKDCSLSYMRWWLRRHVTRTLSFRLLTMSLIMIDVVIVLIDLFDFCAASKTSLTLGLIDFVISIFFVLEIFLRIFSLSPSVFFQKRHWFNIVDLIVVIVTFTVSLLTFMLVQSLRAQNAFDEHGCPIASSQDSPVGWINIAKILVAFRALRFVRLVRLIRIYTEHHQIKRAIRATVSQNKRRYQRGDVDIDLTYVTRRIIATSFPSSGLMAWYRNNIGEVAHFLEQHHAHHYRLYNLCSERTYDERKFANGEVRHWPIDDHNVPKVCEIIDFVADVDQYLAQNDKNVVVIHCKGGKGRTGTMICVLLIHFELFSDANSSLEYFGQRRTDVSLSRTFQGVETASQIRYVSYYETLKKRGVVRWPKVAMKIDKIVLEGIESVGNGDGSDLSLSIWQLDGGLQEISKRFVASSRSVAVMENVDAVVQEDVRLKFCSSRNHVPKGYENCAFYFWFHTSFVYWDEQLGVRGQDGGRVLRLRRHQVDNPHKEKTWSVYKHDFAIVLYLSIISVEE